MIFFDGSTVGVTPAGADAEVDCPDEDATEPVEADATAAADAAGDAAAGPVPGVHPVTANATEVAPTADTNKTRGDIPVKRDNIM